MKLRKFLGLAFVVSLALAPSLLGHATPASAAEFCYVKQTADGFVALRKKPSPSAKLVGRMLAGDEVMLGQGAKGNWLEVFWWRGDDRLTRGFSKKSGHGWVYRKLIDEECG